MSPEQPAADNSPGKLESSNLRRHDLIVASIVWCIALATLVESWFLTFHLTLPGVDPEQAWLVSPGIFPLALSAGLLCMFSVIIWIAIREGEFSGHFSKSNILSFLLDRGNLTQIAQISLLCLYVFGLLGRVHFGVASALYLFASMMITKAARWYVIVIVAVMFSAAITYVFGSVMKIPLP